ncbi:MAG: ABC transporter ATP-binding protein, partial [Peptococcaceae bacterium]|nr:ABC transporter ATP-binding protein [Peptococcaceae bacterium]
VFNLLTGVLEPDRGEILFGGKPLSGLKPHRIAAAGIARTFQNLQLFGSMTVLENVMTGAHLRGRRGFLRSALRLPGRTAEDMWMEREALSLLDDVGLAGAAGLPASALPFGQQRLLEIARALASGPRLLLLDEPAAGLNSTETRTLAGYLKRLKERGLTMLLVEHDMETVMAVADRILVLDFGSAIAEGTPAGIRSNPAVIKAYLGDGEDVA